MSAEQDNGPKEPPPTKEEVFDELKRLLDVKEPRLAKGLRKYIRGLKKDDLEQAFKIRERAFDEKVQRTLKAQAARELDDVVINILRAGDPLEEAENQVKAIWIMGALGWVDPKERVENLKEILDSQEPKVAKELGERMAEIRSSVSHLYPVT